MDSGDDHDTRFRSHYADHAGKQRFENARNTPLRSSNNKLLQVSPTNLIRNRQAIKAELNRRLDWQMWMLVAERDPEPTVDPIKRGSPLTPFFFKQTEIF